MVPIGDLLLTRNITGKTWMGYIASPLAQTPRFARIYQGSFGFEMRTGFVPGLHDFLISLKPHTRYKMMIQHERSNKVFPIPTNVDQKNIKAYIFDLIYNITLDNLTTNCDNSNFSCFWANQLHTPEKMNDVNDLKKRILSATSTNNFKLITSTKNIISLHWNDQTESNFSIVRLHKRLKLLMTIASKMRNKKMKERNNFKALSHSQKYLSSGLSTKSIDTFLYDVWEIIFSCSWESTSEGREPCTGNENLENVDTQLTDVSQLRYSYNAYLAVYAIAHALHNVYTCVPDFGPFVNGSCVDGDFQSWQVNIFAFNHKKSSSILLL